MTDHSLFGATFDKLFLQNPVRRRGRSKASLAIVEASARILEEIAPATVRAVCYRLFTEGLIPNMSKASTNKVSTLLVWARETEQIPWHSIVDETREVERVAAWNSPDDIIRAAVNQYRKDYWSTQPNMVEVWSEKGTVRGTLAPVLQEYGVAFRVMHGYGSATAINDIATASKRTEKPYLALYVGDWDPSGLHMSEKDLPGRIQQYGGNVELSRIALTDADTLSGLPSFEADSKQGDPRHQWFVQNYGETCWELDALSPKTLRSRLEARIRSCMDINQWQRDIDVEAAERESMQEFMTTWSKSRLATK